MSLSLLLPLSECVFEARGCHGWGLHLHATWGGAIGSDGRGETLQGCSIPGGWGG